MRDERSEHFASRHVIRARIHGFFPAQQSWHVHCEVCTCALVAEHHGEPCGVGCGQTTFVGLAAGCVMC